MVKLLLIYPIIALKAIFTTSWASSLTTAYFICSPYELWIVALQLSEWTLNTILLF